MQQLRNVGKHEAVGARDEHHGCVADAQCCPICEEVAKVHDMNAMVPPPPLPPPPPLLLLLLLLLLMLLMQLLQETAADLLL